MKNDGCSLSGLPMLKAKLDENFPSKNFPIITFFSLLGDLDFRGMKSDFDFYCKKHILRKSTSFEPFCVKIGWGCSLDSGTGKVRKSRGFMSVN